ncbi:hypothetical protein [Beijerinckia indica]|nr:hypothetical protein [Beijerinckia indica]
MKFPLARANKASFFTISLLVGGFLLGDGFLASFHPAFGQIQTAPAARHRSPTYDPDAGSSLPVDVYRQRLYHNSGTAGRMGLGADPYHPEGPGNVVTPMR